MTLGAVCTTQSGGTSGNSFAVALTGWTATGGSGVTAPAAGDLVLITGMMESTTAATWSQTAGDSFTFHATGDSNTGNGGIQSFAAWRLFDGTETTGATFTCTTSGRFEYEAICIRPDSGFTASIDTWATTLIDAASTSHTANAATAAGTGECSVLLYCFTAAATGTTAISFTKPTGWTAANSRSLAGTASTFSEFVQSSFQTGVSGTVTPGAGTTNVSTVANAYHVLVQQTAIPPAAAPLPVVVPPAAVTQAANW